MLATEQLRTVEQTADFATLIQILDPVEPWEEQSSRSVLRFFLARWPVGAEQVLNLGVHEQVIDVPKISPDQTRQRLGDYLRQPQMAEQLVDVPTSISFLSLQRIVEQIVDNPVPRRDFGGGLHGLHPGQSSTAFGEADHRAAEQNVDIPVLRGAPHDFHQNPLPAAGSSDLPDMANQGFFKHFSPSEISAKIPRTQGSELGADFSSWPP